MKILVLYIKKRWKLILICAALLLLLNGYFFIFTYEKLQFSDLAYLDVLLIFFGFVFLGADIYKFWQFERAVGRFSSEQMILVDRVKPFLSPEIQLILQHNEERYRTEHYRQAQQLSELSDYIAKWSHEIKLPLSALKMMNERNEDRELKGQMTFQLERIQQNLNTLLMASKWQNPQNDLELTKVSLDQAAKAAIRNHSYFLIQQHVEITVQLAALSVYSDARWLVYVLDQLLSNSLKYASDSPKVSLSAKVVEQAVILEYRDNGQGISEQDLPYIFDKGFVGNSFRAGNYRSTGMGLYFARQILERLGHRIEAASVEEQGTIFKIYFADTRDFFLLT